VLSDEALLGQVNEVDVFAEVEPNQKERIILALKKAGNVVGYLGDGINDASALHAADVGLSVDGTVDVAKESADIVLLEKDLGVLACGVKEGRKTFANTLKYVFMATSANFENMFSMAGASLFLSLSFSSLSEDCGNTTASNPRDLFINFLIPTSSCVRFKAVGSISRVELCVSIATLKDL
jgi:magnesium-transporting ATPase (P-type)